MSHTLHWMPSMRLEKGSVIGCVCVCMCVCVTFQLKTKLSYSVKELSDQNVFGFGDYQSESVSLSNAISELGWGIILKQCTMPSHVTVCKYWYNNHVYLTRLMREFSAIQI